MRITTKQFVWFLDDAKTTIRTKLRMSSNQKWVSNWMMKLKYCPPSQVPYKIIVFVLAWTIIRIKMNRSFCKSMMFEVMVHVAYGGACSFTNITGFINQVVYLPRDRLAHHSKNRTLTRRFKVDWPGLHRVAWYMHLLCEVKGVVHSCQWARFVTLIKVYLVLDGLKTAFRLFANLSHSDFSSSGRLPARSNLEVFCWQVKHKSVIGFDTTTFG